MSFYEPKEFRAQHKSNRQASVVESLFDPLVDPEGLAGGNHASYLVRAHHAKSVSLYHKLLESGVCREQARGILPQNMYTQYYGTVNLNNLLKFIDLRIHEGAQWEIQRVAEACLDIAKDLYPETVGAYRVIRGGVNV
jgi:thymidylate synthase (FAD)